MANSTQTATSDGTMVLLDISIDYLDRSEITVYFNGALTTAWSWVGTTEKRISFSPAVPNLTQVLVKRTTDLAELRHSFSLGAAFTAQTLDEDLEQILHIAQEASEGNLGGDFFTDINMHAHKITNVADAVNPQDAVPLDQVQDIAQDLIDANIGSLTGKVSKTGDTMTGPLTPAADLGASLGSSLLRWAAMYTNAFEAGSARVSAAAPQIVSNESDAAADEKAYRIAQYAGKLQWELVNDANSNSYRFLEVDRTGISIDYISLMTGDNLERMRLLSTGEIAVNSTTAIRGGRVSVSADSSVATQLTLADSRVFSAQPSAQVAFVAQYNVGGTYTDIAVVRGTKANATDGSQLGVLQFYVNTGAGVVEAARIDSSMNVGINTAPSAAHKLHVAGSVTGAAAGRGARVTSTILSDVTGSFWSFDSTVATQNASFTLGTLGHFVAGNASKGAANTIGEQIGFLSGDLASAGSNYGFYGLLSSGANKWNLYMPGTASNHLNGDTFIGATASVWNSSKAVIAGSTANYLSHLLLQDTQGYASTPSASLSFGGEINTGVFNGYAQITGKKESANPGSANGELVFKTAFSGNPTEQARLNSLGYLGIKSAGQTLTAALDVNYDTIRLRSSRTPATSNALGNQGDICWDANYLYICIATNTWRRIAHATW